MRYLTILCVLLISCTANESQAPADTKVDIQGHRGARGILPENSIPAFIEAVSLGVTTLELDLAVSLDKRLVVSHEPYMSAEICQVETDSITKANQRSLNIYEMNYEDVLSFDCGSKFHARFPNQKKMRVNKPLLLDLIDTIESIRPMKYNIEIKSRPEWDSLFHPSVAEFGDLVVNTINQSGLSWEAVTIQSFDFRALRYIRNNYPEIRLVQLIENDQPWRENVRILGFSPDVYSCYHKLLTKEIVSEIQAEGIQVVPWTVNDSSDMKQLIQWGVDGLITDYPNIAVDLEID